MLVRLKPIVSLIKVFTVKRTSHKQQHLAFVTIIIILLQGVLLGYVSVYPLYLLGRPLCLNAFQVALLASVQAVATFLLSASTALSKKSLPDMYVAAILGSLAVIVDLLILTFARRIWLLYIGGILFIMILSSAYRCSFSFS